MDVADNFHFLFTAVAKTDGGGGCGVKKSKIVKKLIAERTSQCSTKVDGQWK